MEKLILEKFSITEALPEYDHDCIIWYEDGGVYVGFYHEGAWHDRSWGAELSKTITHWAKFPHPLTTN